MQKTLHRLAVGATFFPAKTLPVAPPALGSIEMVPTTPVVCFHRDRFRMVPKKSSEKALHVVLVFKLYP